ncbi:MAG: hypothetical protein GYB21_00985 [Oceanospirillales bacterium]|nr:hypothetical protein [Oceanospirillales bacterium]
MSVYALSACNQGCLATATTLMNAGGVYTGEYEYTGDECPGSGFNPDAGFDLVDASEYGTKTCYGADGSYMGQVSGNASCPNGVNCYSTTTGQFQTTATDPGSCPEGSVTKVQLSNELKSQTETVQTTNSTTVADDGTVTETQETTKTERAPDGTSVSSSTSTTNTTNPDGSTNSSSSSSVVSSACTGPDCDDEGEPAEEESFDGDAALICGSGVELQCTGSPILCGVAQMEHDQYCEMKDYDGALAHLQELIDDGLIEGAEFAEDGTLTVLDGGTFDISEEFELPQLFADSGAAGSCPAPYQIGDSFHTVFSWQPICDMLGMIRPIVLFAAVFFGGGILARAVTGVSYVKHVY